MVKLAIDKGTGERYAVKIIDKKKCFMQSSNRKDAIMGEVEILRKLSHPHIINIKDVFDTEKTLYLGKNWCFQCGVSHEPLFLTNLQLTVAKFLTRFP